MVSGHLQYVKVGERRTFLELDCDNYEGCVSVRERAFTDTAIVHVRALKLIDADFDFVASPVLCATDSKDETSSSVGSTMLWGYDDEDEYSERSCCHDRKPIADEALLRGDARTTLVLKQLPLTISQPALCTLMNNCGFGGSYNFLYAPVNFKTGMIFGYCFINFVEPLTACWALHRLHGLEVSGSIVEASWSDEFQGLDAQIERYRNCPVMHRTVPRAFKPVLLERGLRVPFPKPTSRIRVPNGWCSMAKKAQESMKHRDVCLMMDDH